MNYLKKILLLILVVSVLQSCSSDKEEYCGPALYTDFLHSSPGTVSHFEINEAATCAKTNNRPILIHFTGHTVNTEMESRLSASKRIIKRINNNFTYVKLYCDETTQVQPDYWVVDETGDTLKTMGRININFQTTRFKSTGQPYFLITNHALEPLIKPITYTNDIKLFKEFLDLGLENFHK